MKKLYYSLLLIVITLIIGYACQDPLESIVIPVSPKLSTYEVSIQVNDVANPTSLSEPDLLTVELLGSDADKILNNGGERVFTAQHGIINLAVDKNYSDFTEPLRFTVKVSGENYLTTTIPVIVDGTDELIHLYANLVNIDNPPAGVDVKKETISINDDGSVSQGITISTISEGDAEVTETSTEISIESGTVFKNAEGEVIIGSELEIQIVNFDSNEPASLGSFPGGFSPNSIIDQNGEEVTTGTFITAGFTSIDMFVNGEEVKEFSQPIDVKMKINDNTLNPETNKVIELGDVIPIWSYSNDDGQWIYHGNGLVTPSLGGGLEVKYTTTHLSSFNLDFLKSYTRCSSGIINIEFEGLDRLPSGRSYGLKMYLVHANTDQPLGNGAISTNFTNNTKNITLYNSVDLDMQLLIVKEYSYTISGIDNWHSPALPDIDSVVFYENINSYSYTYNYRYLIYKSEVFNGCDDNLTIPLYSAIQSAELDPGIEVTVEYAGKCGNRKIAPSVELYRKKANGQFGYVGYVDQGEITMSVPKLDSTYLFGFYWGDTFYEDSLLIDSENMIDTNLNLDNFCDEILKNI